MVKVKTMAKRQSRALNRVKEWCRANRHQSIPDQVAHLRNVLRGHYAYYGRRDNTSSIRQFYRKVKRIWKNSLSRRSRRSHVTWKKLDAILARFPLPQPRLMHGALSDRSKIPLFGEFV